MPTESPRESAYSTYHEEQVNPIPVYEVPITEATAPPFLPYRGTQMHGVDPGRIQLTQDEDAEGGKVVTGYFEQPEDDVNPVPVRIVGAAATEIKQWRAYQVTITEAATMVLSAKMGRSVAHLRQLPTGNVTVWLSPDSNVGPNNGFPLNGEDEFTTLTEGSVWATTGDPAKSTTVAVHTEFATPQ